MPRIAQAAAQEYFWGQKFYLTLSVRSKTIHTNCSLPLLAAHHKQARRRGSLHPTGQSNASFISSDLAPASVKVSSCERNSSLWLRHILEFAPPSHNRHLALLRAMCFIMSS